MWGKRVLTAVAAVGVMALSACGDAGGSGASTASTTTGAASSGPASSGPPSGSSSGSSASGPSSASWSPTVRPRADVDLAVADLAEREGVSTDAVQVVDLEDVTWTDASLGCPQPDRVYAQVVVDGQRLTLETGGRRFAYHQGGADPFTYCAHPSPAPSPTG